MPAEKSIFALTPAEKSIFALTPAEKSVILVDEKWHT
jgi:hypothetical protein